MLTGTGNLWTGVAIAVGATVVAFVVHAKTWVKVLVILAALAGIGNTISVESQLNDLRDDFDGHRSAVVNLT